MKKGSREFFEVFRRGPQAEKPAGWWLKRPAPPAAAGPGTAEKAAAAPQGGGSGPRPNRIVLSLSHEAIVVCAVVLAGMLVGAFVWGHSLRAAKEAAIPGISDPAPAQKPSALALETPEPLKPPYWTLQVLGSGAGAVINAQGAQELVNFLRGKGYDAFVLGKGRSCTVNVGRFARKDTPEADTLKQEISVLVYGNKRWFISCSWHKVTAQER